MQWTVTNGGPDDATGTWNDTLFLVPSGTSGLSQAVNLGAFQHTTPLAVGNTYTRDVVVTLPIHIQGPFTFDVLADSASQVNESVTTDKLLASVPIDISLTPRPDLQVTSVTAPTEVTAGGVIDVNWTVTNFGTVATPVGGSHWSDGVYVGLTNSLAGAIFLGALPNGSALQPGQSYSSQDSFTLPVAIAGNVFVIVRADDSSQVDQFPNLTDHTRSAPLAVNAQPVPPPDLATSAVIGPGVAFDGTTVSVQYTVTNLGTGVTFPDTWTDAIWLTLGKDRPNPARGDVLLGSFSHTGALQVGQSYTNDVQVTLPAHISGQYFPDPPGRIAPTTSSMVTLSGNVNPDDPHGLFSDNYKATPLTVIETPPAGPERDQRDSHLRPRLGGTNVTVSWTAVANNGANTTDGSEWLDAIYISTTPTLNTGDQHLVYAQIHDGALSPGDSRTRQQRHLPARRRRPTACSSSSRPTSRPTSSRRRTPSEQQLIDEVLNNQSTDATLVRPWMNGGPSLAQPGFTGPVAHDNTLGRAQHHYRCAGRSCHHQHQRAGDLVLRRAGHRQLDGHQPGTIRRLFRHSILAGIRLRLGRPDV